MSYEIKLGNNCNHTIIEEDQIPDSDNKTIVLNRLATSYDAVVRINDFVRSRNSTTEKQVKENVTDTIIEHEFIPLQNAPIYDGSKRNILATTDDVIVQIEIIDENVSEQFTGNDDFFYVSGKPILKSNNFDFNSIVSTNDIIIKLNGDILPAIDIVDIDAKFGRIQLSFKPLVTDEVLISYYFKAKIKTLDAENGAIYLKEKPATGQNVNVIYFAKVNNGWQFLPSTRSLIPSAKDIVFYDNLLTSRKYIVDENVTNQFNGTNSIFQTSHYPLLPLYQSFTNSFYDTLNNAVVVKINGERVQVLDIDPEVGLVKIAYKPQDGDDVTISYYYQTQKNSDRITIDYGTSLEYCVKCQGNSDLADYLVDSLGEYVTIEREEKLIQDLKKISITIKGSDKVATWYGTVFNTIIGTKQLPSYLKTRIAGELISALSNLKNAQIQQEQYQEVSDEEFINFIRNIEVTISDVDITYYTATVNVVNQAGKEYEATIDLTQLNSKKLYRG